MTRFEARIFGIQSDRHSKKEEEKERIVDEGREGGEKEEDERGVKEKDLKKAKIKQL